MLPRTGRSFHLPSGGAVYFDTGVIEVATPIIELEPGCCVRAVRSLWEQIRYLRGELDVLERTSGNRLQLAGFSAHYNISFPATRESASRTTDKLAWLLCHLLPLPAMLLAANRLSTGIGVRPREGRIEITADFTPDPDLMIAAVSTTVGLSWGVMQWEDYEVGRLEEMGVPVVEGFKPRKHTSRKGWLARFDCYPRSPFTADVNAQDWQFRDGKVRSLRQAARMVMAQCDKGQVESMGDSECFEHTMAVLEGRARSLLDFESRPSSYEDVGRVIPWKRRSRRSLPLSRYEKVIERIISKRRLNIAGGRYRPLQMIGWYEVALQEERTGVRRVFNLDELARHCGI
jgi:hypothetical protein